MAEEEKEISELEFREELSGDDLIPVETTTNTFATSLIVLKNWLLNYLVGKTGDETISGVKTFLNKIHIPTPASNAENSEGANVEYVNDKVGQITPKTGYVYGYAGNTPPTGYLFCDGAAISRTTYAALFAIIGTTYGAGNGTTTFNLPNMRLHGGTLAVSVYGQDKALGLVSKTPTNGYKAHSACTAGNPGFIALGTYSNSSVSKGGTTASSNTGNASWAAANLVGVNTSASVSGLAGSATINNSTQTMKLIIKY